jgi:benzoylsuccinyl-CoA thiolase BbsB subunit
LTRGRGWDAIASGLYDIGLVIGVESMTTSPIAGKLIPPEVGDLSGEMGHNMPTYFALSMRRHMEKYGTTLE